MNKQLVIVFLVFSFFLFPFYHISNAADLTLNNTPTQVCFSPREGCTDAIIDQIAHAKSEILVQAYSFTSAPVAKALLNAHKRGVKVETILDKSQRKEIHLSHLPGKFGYPHFNR